MGAARRKTRPALRLRVIAEAGEARAEALALAERLGETVRLELARGGAVARDGGRLRLTSRDGLQTLMERGGLETPEYEAGLMYPSGSSNENDRYVAWAYRESQRLGRNVWTIGQLGRTCGTGKGVMPNALMVDPDGYLYEHETGLNYGGALPYVESGPVEIGQGEFMAELQRIAPDELQDGNLTATLFGRLWPDGAEFTSGAFTLTSPTDLLFQAREIRVRFTSNAPAGWRVGAMRLELIQGDPL